jgi:hypothetical protein
MSLFNQTGHESDDAVKTEVKRLLGELSTDTEAMTPKERSFVEDMNDKVDRITVSGKQLFWLRDLYEKYCI